MATEAGKILIPKGTDEKLAVVLQNMTADPYFYSDFYSTYAEWIATKNTTASISAVKALNPVFSGSSTRQLTAQEYMRDELNENSLAYSWSTN